MPFRNGLEPKADIVRHQIGVWTTNEEAAPSNTKIHAHLSDFEQIGEDVLEKFTNPCKNTTHLESSPVGDIRRLLGSSFQEGGLVNTLDTPEKLDKSSAIQMVD